jgi:CheY-like chemotaxis protein
MLRRLIGEDIRLVTSLAPGLGPVYADPGQVEQVIINLVVNGRDAMPSGGTLTLETMNLSPGASAPHALAGIVREPSVLLTVTDTGTGMDAETRAHLFEPFFTTKAVGQGTGLGLATLYGVVKQNQGFINVYSEPGQGTSFKIYLPRHRDEVAPVPIAVPAAPVRRGHETVLLVEDEPTLLNLVRLMLEKLGYRVLAAGTPGEAVRWAKQHAGEIHVLVTDVVMPEMNGRELTKGLLALYPDLSRLFMSGYTADVIAHHGVLDEGVHFIQKPFSTKDLAARIREVLSRRDGVALA